MIQDLFMEYERVGQGLTLGLWGSYGVLGIGSGARSEEWSASGLCIPNCSWSFGVFWILDLDLAQFSWDYVIPNMAAPGDR